MILTGRIIYSARDGFFGLTFFCTFYGRYVMGDLDAFFERDLIR